MTMIRLLCAGLFLLPLCPWHANAVLVPLTGAVEVKAGPHACVLTSAGGVKCWGNGVLGDGNTFSSRSAAGDVIGLTSGVSAIGVGKGGHTCAATSAGGVKCWGFNGYGQLGDGTTTLRPLPVDVVGLGAVTAIAGGNNHTCAILSGGNVKCWGDNSRAQLGLGTTGGTFSTPQDVVGLAGSAVAITAGLDHTCVLIAGNGAQCWGYNAAGQLGDGSTTNQASPVAVSGLAGNLLSIAAGGTHIVSGGNGSLEHTCAVTAGGGAKCWGSNFFGNLGDGSATSHLTPFDVSGLTSGVASISAGGYVSGSPFFASYSYGAYTCAATSGGAAKCWGGYHISYATPYYPAPVDVPGLASGVIEIASGSDFSCALTGDTAVRCWHIVAETPSPVMTGTTPQGISNAHSSGPVPIGSYGTVFGTGTGSGIPVTFTSLTPAICTGGASSPGGINETVANVFGVANGMCRIQANQAGNAYYDPATPVEIAFRVGDKIVQTITFGTAPSVPVGGYGSLVATASSGLVPVTFHTNTPSICSVSGNIVTGVAQGSCTIAADQAGDELYAAVEATQTFPITANTGTHGLIVTTFGTGSGTVTSVPSGIDCGDVCVGNFSTSVTLTATAAAGSKFAGWGGTACDRTTAPCTLPMSADTFLGAMFVIDSPIARLGNISTRGLASVNDPLIGGFVIGGNTPKTVVITAAGPSLNAYGITNALSNPNLTLVRSADNAIIATNDNWGSASNAGQISATGLAPNNALEPAIMAALAPGAYTAIVRGAASEGVGIALVGVFEADHPEIPLSNLSSRAVVATGNNVMIAGFIVQGSNPQTVVVNVAGPYLANFGITNPLANPKLTIVRSSDNVVIATNDDWQSQTNPSDVAAIQATGFQPNDPAEPAVKLTLPPGAYTAIVEGVGGTIGTAVVGVFAAP